MININFRFIFILIGSILTLGNLFFLKNSLRATSLINKDNNKEAIKIDINQNRIINYDKVKSLFKLKNSSFNSLADNLSIENNIVPINVKSEVIKPLSTVDIESNVQYEINNIFYAEGNVIINFFNAKITGEKATYDKEKKLFIIENNVTFKKGNQYFEASKFNYNLKTNKGYLNDVYGILDLENINKDLDLEYENYIFDKNYKKKIVENIKYIDSGTLGLRNDFDSERVLNIKDVKFKISKIKKWRFKTKKIFIDPKKLNSKNVLFTNDPYNKPQFILKSKEFLGEIVDNKLKIVSKNSWITFDELVSIPIGKRTITDNNDPISSWGIGSDHEEKDGFYLSRNYGQINLSDNFGLKLRPYFLIQRGLKQETKAFRKNGESILSEKSINKINFYDYFALSSQMRGKYNDWDINLTSSLNTLNVDRISQANRTKLKITRKIDLDKYKFKNIYSKKYLNDNLKFRRNLDLNKRLYGYIYPNQNYFDILNINDIYLKNKDKDHYLFSRNLDLNSVDEFINNHNIDLQIYGVFREKVKKGYSGDEEIYFGKGLRLGKRYIFNKDFNYNDLALIYDIGKFKAEERSKKRFINLYRNVFAINYKNKLSIWEKKNLDNNININYKYSPKVIKQGLFWQTKIDAGLFFYEDGLSQKAISFSSGPNIILGSLNNSFLSYTNLELLNKYIIKDGVSAFKFDNIDDSAHVSVKIKQQLIGPILLGASSHINLDENVRKLKFDQITLDINRRAYSVGAFYEPSGEKIGIQFNIFNFDYKGISSTF